MGVKDTCRDRTMSQRAVESILGRMITDAAFRTRFLAEPAMVCHEGGLDLTGGEIAALLQINTGMLDSVAEGLDPKIVRALTVLPDYDPVTARRRSA